MNFKSTILIAVIIFIAGCAASKISAPSQVDVDRVQPKFPNYSLADLNDGKMLYEKHCGNCHGLKSPTSETEESWKKIVPDMVIKVNKNVTTKLDAKAEESILRYVITMSTASPAK